MFDENGNYIPEEENTASENINTDSMENAESFGTDSEPAAEPEYSAPEQSERAIASVRSSERSVLFFMCESSLETGSCLSLRPVSEQTLLTTF